MHAVVLLCFSVLIGQFAVSYTLNGHMTPFSFKITQFTPSLIATVPRHQTEAPIWRLSCQYFGHR